MFQGLGHALAQHRCNGELAVIFQARDHLVDREGIGQRGPGTIERGRVLQAGAAHLAIRCGDGTLRTLRLVVPGQVVTAAGAQRLRIRGRTAQQAGQGRQTPKY